ncbi:threonine/serine exporter family protein [Macrococcus capreoli]|uniref:threonine/serine exporter family protein n=1 Tax=Macrococcus capreoli TaxID=2982690 RepID=UPI0021D580D8|nr:threonine/serine exporter family protein [Macrococcus sp. TMW 2.2395]MCU7556297.1 threonine/serine exporter family protein [Macrococcus sp. TMW 2.2395]
MTLLFQTIISFFASIFFAIVFNAPRKLLMACGFVGGIGWMVFTIAETSKLTMAVGAFLGSLSLSLCAHLFARYYKRPVIIFNVAGIIPLVPGGVAYDATKNLIISDYSEALSKGMEATLISGAIAFGLLIAEIVFQSTLKGYKHFNYYRLRRKKGEHPIQL